MAPFSINVAFDVEKFPQSKIPKSIELSNEIEKKQTQQMEAIKF